MVLAHYSEVMVLSATVGLIFLLTLVLAGSVTAFVTTDGVFAGKRGYNKAYPITK